ncbi:MAG TPA: hypothetical protein PLQ87_09655, partial [Phycisphaerae bacterium]|nr:hypothetical protein [Phycisphaerae bacterium]
MTRHLQATAIPTGQMRLIGQARLEAAPAAEGGARRPPTVTIAAYGGGVVKPYPFGGRAVVIDLAGLRAAEPIAILLDHTR